MAKAHLFSALTHILERPLTPGNKVWVYNPKKTSLATTYSTSAGAAGSNPTTVDSNGFIDLFVDPNGPYSVIITDSSGAVVHSFDDINPITESLYVKIKDGTLGLSQMATTTADRLIGTDGSGNVGLITLSTNVSLSSKALAYGGSAEDNTDNDLVYDADFSGTTLDLSSYFSTDYDIYIVDILNFQSTGATVLGVQFSASSSFLTTANYYVAGYGFHNTASGDDDTITKKSGDCGSSKSTFAPITYDTSAAGNGSKMSLVNATTYGLNHLSCEIINKSYPIVISDCLYEATASQLPFRCEMYSAYDSSITVDGLRIYSDSTWSGGVIVRRLKNS